MNLTQALTQKLIFVGGKGGVGKTSVSLSIAQFLAQKRDSKILWVTFEDPAYPLGSTEKISKTLHHLNAEAHHSFEEYMSIKLGALGVMAKLFLNNKLIQALSQIAPGLHELVLLGKVWFERENFDHTVVDMPSTGYNLAMFHSTANYAHLFKGGPIHRDAEAMLSTFADPTITSHLIVALPEEMPLRESVDLKDKILSLFPKNKPIIIVNKRIQAQSTSKMDPLDYKDPLAHSITEFIERRSNLEEHNLEILKQEKLKYDELPWVGKPVIDQLEKHISKVISR